MIIAAVLHTHTKKNSVYVVVYEMWPALSSQAEYMISSRVYILAVKALQFEIYIWAAVVGVVAAAAVHVIYCYPRFILLFSIILWYSLAPRMLCIFDEHKSIVCISPLHEVHCTQAFILS